MTLLIPSMKGTIMRKILLVALPLVSLALLAGCSHDNCATCGGFASAPGAKTSTKLAAADYPPGSVLTEEQWDALVATDKAKGTATDEAKPAVAKTAEKAPEVEVAQKAEEPAPPKRIVSTTMPTIPTMPLPKGWSYVGEQDLTDGRLNVTAADQLYTQTSKPSNKG